MIREREIIYQMQKDKYHKEKVDYCKQRRKVSRGKKIALSTFTVFNTFGKQNFATQQKLKPVGFVLHYEPMTGYLIGEEEDKEEIKPYS